MLLEPSPISVGGVHLSLRFSVAFYLKLKNAHRFPFLGHENFLDSGLPVSHVLVLGAPWIFPEVSLNHNWGNPAQLSLDT